MKRSETRENEMTILDHVWTSIAENDIAFESLKEKGMDIISSGVELNDSLESALVAFLAKPSVECVVNLVFVSLTEEPNITTKKEVLIILVLFKKGWISKTNLIEKLGRIPIIDRDELEPSLRELVDAAALMQEDESDGYSDLEDILTPKIDILELNKLTKQA